MKILETEKKLRNCLLLFDRQTIVCIAMSLKAIYIFKAISIKMTMTLLKEQEKELLSFIWKHNFK